MTEAPRVLHFSAFIIQVVGYIMLNMEHLVLTNLSALMAPATIL